MTFGVYVHVCHDYTLIVVLCLFFLVIDLICVRVVFLLRWSLLIIITDSKLWVASLNEHSCFSGRLATCHCASLLQGVYRFN